MTTSCSSSPGPESCRNDAVALSLKFVAIASILVAGVVGIVVPLFGRKQTNLIRTDGTLFVAAKAFAAGVILATGFVHMLSDGTEALSDPCLPEFPWSKFPFTGFFAMVAALLTLLVDFVGTQHYEQKHGVARKSGMEKEGGAIHIVGMQAHAAHHSHGQVDEHGCRDGDVESGLRHIVVSQILELGIVSHSVIIGLSLGISQSPCTAQFKTTSTAIMACFFAITMPASIGIGIALTKSYNPDTPGALITEGILDALSAGILVYMALVDLIAVDFLSKKMSCNFKLQVISYCSLFLGAGLMSALAIWA